LPIDDGTEKLYELEHGELINVPSESEINPRIAMFLLIYFSQLGIPVEQLTMKTEVAVSGARVSVRIPDLLVLSAELAAERRKCKFCPIEYHTIEIVTHAANGRVVMVL
jgi:Uma2 family endonuclease